jgi:hypothetical protein
MLKSQAKQSRETDGTLRVQPELADARFAAAPARRENAQRPGQGAARQGQRIGPCVALRRLPKNFCPDETRAIFLAILSQDGWQIHYSGCQQYPKLCARPGLELPTSFTHAPSLLFSTTRRSPERSPTGQSIDLPSLSSHFPRPDRPCQANQASAYSCSRCYLGPLDQCPLPSCSQL